MFIKERGSFFVGCSPEFSMAVATCCYFETMTPESARAAGWTEMRDNKYKMRREVGGYIYEYYLCRQKEYLVSCFQELVGPTAATQEVRLFASISLKKTKLQYYDNSSSASTLFV